MDKLVKNNKFLNYSFLYSGITLSVIVPLGLYAHAGTIPYPNPRTQIQGSYVSGNHQFMGDVDSLLPLYGSTKRFVFADIAGRYGSHNYWFASPGGGFRGVYHNQLFGIYGFGDYQKTDPATKFWVFNPGIEWMTPTVDVHLNGYFPNRKQKQLAPIVFDSDLGNYSNVRFQEHTQFDFGTKPMLAISRGADTELGYSMDLQGYRARVYGGGYYYHSPVNEAKDIRGAFAGVQLPLNKFADVLVTNSYNNLDHNRVALTLRLTLDGQRRFSSNVEDRVLDRIERHSGIIQTAAGSLTQKVMHRSEEVYRTNIWFFEPAPPVFSATSLSQAEDKKTFSSCTYEHPCNDFNQEAVTQINQLSQGANFYVKSGDYTLSNGSALSIYRDQSIYGRNADYKKPALGIERPMLTGGILAHGGNNFDSVQVSNNNFVSFNQLYFEHGIAALVVAPTTDSSAVRINNSNFTVTTNTGTATSSGYTSAIIAASGETYLNNSTLVSQNAGTNMDNSIAYGLLTLNNAQIVGVNNTISSTSAGRFAYGTAAFNSSKLNVHKTIINAAVTGMGEAHSLHLRDFSHADMSQVTLQANSTGSFAVGATTNQQSSLNLRHSDIVATMRGTGSARAVYLRELSKTNINHTSITASSSGATAYAVLSDQNSVLNLNDSILRANAESTSEALGFGLRSKAKINGVRNSIQVQSSGLAAYGALLLNESELALKDSTILVNTTGSGQAQGIQLANYTQAFLTDMDIKVSSSNSTVFGGLLFESSKLQLKTSNITATMLGGFEAKTLQIADSAEASISQSTLVANASELLSTPMYVLASGKLTLNDSTLIANNTATGPSRGMQLESNAEVIVNNSTITANSLGSLVIGVAVSEESKITTNNTSIAAKMAGQYGTVHGIELTGTSQANLTKTKITATNVNNSAYGAVVSQSGVLNLNQSQVLAQNSMTQGTAFALSNADLGSKINVTNSNLSVKGFHTLIAEGSNISFKGTNTCIINGIKTSCE